jgi:hypothetical protein
VGLHRRSHPIVRADHRCWNSVACPANASASLREKDHRSTESARRHFGSGTTSLADDLIESADLGQPPLTTSKAVEHICHKHLQQCGPSCADGRHGQLMTE